MSRVRLLSEPRKFSDRVAHSLQELDKLYKERSRQQSQPPTTDQIKQFFAENTPHPPPVRIASMTEQHPRQYLESVMHDTRLSLTLRMDAASHLLRIYGLPVREVWNGVTIRIGGIPDASPATVDASDFCSDLYDCIKRTTPCFWQKRYPHLRDCKSKIIQQQMQFMDVKGHA